MLGFCPDHLRRAQEIQNRARALGRQFELVDPIAIHRRSHANGVGDVVRVDRDMLVPGLAGAGVDGAGDIDRE